MTSLNTILTTSHKKLSLITGFLILFSLSVFAQKESSIWYFGYGAGIDFNSEPPIALTNGAMQAFEGCASACNAKGELLFYTDGVSIWNKNHTKMPNGAELLGNFSSTQSAVVVKMPASKTLYYVFTVAYERTSDGLRYSVVDMSAQGGLGDVVSTAKNIQITSPTCEKIAVVKHSNNVDYWVITKMFGSNAFHSYLLTKNGLSSAAVISYVGVASNGSSLESLGYLKSSQDGTKIASVNYQIDNIGLFDFDKKTGKLSNPISLETNISNSVYGGEFSPNGQFIYVSEALGGGRIVQFNLTAGKESDIQKSMTVIGLNKKNTGAIQLAPNGKLYVTKLDTFLGVIENPDSLGTACQYNADGFYLSGKSASYGLPTFYGNVLNSFRASNICLGDSTEFVLTTGYIDSVYWDFGEQASGKSNFSKKMNPKHKFQMDKTYTVTATLFIGNRKDTLSNEVLIKPVKQFSLGNDTFFCAGDSLLLDVAHLPSPYLWSDSTTTDSLKVKKGGKYWLQLSLSSCLVTDTILVEERPYPMVDLGPDTVLCFGDTMFLNATLLGANYLWHDGYVLPNRSFTNSIQPWVKADLNGCKATDTIDITFKPLPSVSLGNDTTICDQGSWNLDVNSNFDAYRWNDNSMDSFLLVNQSGQYWVEVSENECVNRDTIQIIFDTKPSIQLPNRLELCFGERIELKPTFANANYLWNDGSVDSTYEVRTEGVYWVEVSNSCGKVVDTSMVFYSDCKCYLEVPNAFRPNNDNLNDVFRTVNEGCEFKFFILSIYNRWGELIFVSEQENQGWNGNYKGIDAPEGVYMYVLKYSTPNGINKSNAGTVTLLR